MKNSAMIEALKLSAFHIKQLAEQIEEEGHSEAAYLAFFQIADFLEQASIQKRSPLFQEIEKFTAGKSLTLNQLEAVELSKCAIILLMEEFNFSQNRACELISNYIGASKGFMRSKMPSRAKYKDYILTKEGEVLVSIINDAKKNNYHSDSNTRNRLIIQDFAHKAREQYQMDIDGNLSKLAFSKTTSNIDDDTSNFFDCIE